LLAHADAWSAQKGLMLVCEAALDTQRAHIEALEKVLPAKDAESLARVCMSFAADMLHKQDDIGQRFWTEQAKRLWAYADLATAGK
jgi:hypothetical protein